jgi:hypothetical protein
LIIGCSSNTHSSVYVASQAALSFHLIAAGMSPHQIAITEKAISQQVNRDVRKHWNTPPITFGNTGIPIHMVDDQTLLSQCGYDVSGCHGYDANGPNIWIGIYPWWFATQAIDHEMIETIVNPHPTIGSQHVVDGYVAEICDPVEGTWYQGSYNVMLSDFVYPRWYNVHATGQMDIMGIVPGPLNSSFGSPANLAVNP